MIEGDLADPVDEPAGGVEDGMPECVYARVEVVEDDPVDPVGEQQVDGEPGATRIGSTQMRG